MALQREEITDARIVAFREVLLRLLIATHDQDPRFLQDLDAEFRARVAELPKPLPESLEWVARTWTEAAHLAHDAAKLVRGPKAKPLPDV